jgi:choline kinase
MTNTIRKAVILAAGSGNRIAAAAKDTPKPLLPLDGKKGGLTFLDWHLQALSKIGVEEIYLVGNNVTHGTRLRSWPTDEGIRATWILNPTEDLSTSGSGHSASIAFESEHGILDGKSRVILMDADIVYDPAILGVLANAPGKESKTLVSSSFRQTDEEVLVFGDSQTDGRAPRYHGKGLLGTPLVKGCRCLGEATGILLWEPGDHATLREVTRWQMKFSTPKHRSEHEDISQRMMLLGKMSAVGIGDEYEFMECDTADDYRVLVEDVFPRLRAR